MAERDPNRQLEFIIDETARLMARVYNKHYRQTGMNATQVAALVWLGRSPNGMSQSELANRLGIGKAAAGKLVDTLESGRLVHRERPAADRRIQIVAVTASGSKIVREVDANTEAVRRAIRKGTTKEERKQAIDVIDRVRANLRGLGK